MSDYIDIEEWLDAGAPEVAEGHSFARLSRLLRKTNAKPARPSAATPTEAGYAYHATNLERAHDIAREGLQLHKPWDFTDQETWPDGSVQPRSYHSAKANGVWHFAPEEGQPVILRTHMSKHVFKPERWTGDLYSTKPIKPEHIEMLMDSGEWHPLHTLLDTGLRKDEKLDEVPEPAPVKQVAPKKPRKKKTVTPDELNLVGVHNLSANNLHHAVELGGLVAPSLAITHKDHPLNGFGEISLVAHHDLIDPEKNPVFDADIYSPRHPRPRYKVNEKVMRPFVEWIEPYGKQVDGYFGDFDNEFAKEGPERVTSDYRKKRALGLAYLGEKGVQLKPPMRTKRNPGRMYVRDWASQPPMQEFVKQNPLGINDDVTDDFHQRMNEAAKKSVEMHWRKVADAAGWDEQDVQDGIARSMGRDFDDKGLVTRPHQVHEDARNSLEQEIDPHAYGEAIENELKNHPEFESWARAKLKPLNAGYYLPKYVDKPDRGPVERKRAYTPENILEEMTRTVRQGEGFNYGPGSARALGAKKFRDLDEVKKHRHKIVSKEEFKKHKEAMDERMTQLATELQPYYRGGEFSSLGNLYEAIGESYKRGKWLSKELAASQYKNVPPHLQAKVAEFARDLKDMPTEYFESKPQRVVRLNEFKGAAIPHTAGEDVIQALHNAGIQHIERYNKDDDSDRGKAIQRIAGAHKLMLNEMPMAKGSMRRLAPFDPAKADPKQADAVFRWQEDTSQKARREMPRLEGAGRARALHKLSAATQARMNPVTNKRQFLLHRGMSTYERELIAPLEDDGTIIHHGMTSWTPDYSTARRFSQQYGGPLVSAWIDEDSVHHVPMQFGNMTPGRPRPTGPNRWRNEHEVFVGPHRSQLAVVHPTEMPMAKMAIADIPPGKKTRQKPHQPGFVRYDYSHVLPEAHRQAGYKLSLDVAPSGLIRGTIHHRTDRPEGHEGNAEPGEIGMITGIHAPSGPSDRSMSVGAAHVRKSHWNKGFGTALYEALYAHAKNVLGAERIQGGMHSSMASQLHQKLSAKHGLAYQPTPNPSAPEKEGGYDDAFAPYEYTLKSEGDEVSKLLQHQDPAERSMALKLHGVKPHHLVMALNDPEMAETALTHPAVDSSVMDAALQLLPTRHMAMKLSGLTPAQLVQAYVSSRGFDDADDVLHAIEQHPSTDESVIRHIYDQGDATPGLLRHNQTPSDVLAHALEHGSRDALMVAAEHSAAPEEQLGRILLGPANAHQLVVAHNESIPAEAARDLLQRGHLMTDEHQVALRRAVVQNPGVPDEIVEVALRDLDPEISFLARVRLGQHTDEDHLDL